MFSIMANTRTIDVPLNSTNHVAFYSTTCLSTPAPNHGGCPPDRHGHPVANVQPDRDHVLPLALRRVPSAHVGAEGPRPEK